jgi:PhnB protein
MPVENQFWGDRMGTLTDPFGHSWSIATHVEDVAPDQLQSRLEELGRTQKQPETV